MNIKVYDNKKYVRCRVSEECDSKVFNGYLENYEVDIDLLQRLSKDLGFSYDLYQTLSNIDEKAASTMVTSMSMHNKHPEVVFLVDEEEKRVIDYTLDYERLPILNSEFVHRVSSLADTSDAIEISEYYYCKEDKTSSIILKKKSPIIIEEKYEGKASKFIEYSVGVLLVNDEVGSASTRLVLYVDGQPLYLPASYYNTTTSRYRRSTDSSVAALEVLMLRIIDDLRDDALHSKIYDLHFRYRANKYILASYEEYNTLLRVMRKIPTIIEDNSFLEALLSKYEEFEKKYTHLEDQKSSYIWRCTALSDIPVGALVSITSQILTDLSAPAIEYFAVRELLGAYVSTNRIAEEIAKEDIR